MGLERKWVSKWEKELMKTLHPAHNKMKKHCCKDTTQHYTREYKAWRNWSFSSILVVPFAKDVEMDTECFWVSAYSSIKWEYSLLQML